MKIKLKFTTSDYLVIIFGAITIIVTLYNEEIKTLINHIMEKWRILLLIISISVIFWRIILIYVRNKIDSKFSNIENYNNQLIDITKTNQVYQHINTAIVYNSIMNMCNNAKDKREAANALLSHFETNGINIPEWKNYGIPTELITEMQIIYHEIEKEKLKTQSK